MLPDRHHAMPGCIAVHRAIRRGGLAIPPDTARGHSQLHKFQLFYLPMAGLAVPRARGKGRDAACLKKQEFSAVQP